jgi:hypothetical protein
VDSSLYSSQKEIQTHILEAHTKAVVVVAQAVLVMRTVFVGGDGTIQSHAFERTDVGYEETQAGGARPRAAILGPRTSGVVVVFVTLSVTFVVLDLVTVGVTLF